MGLKETYAVNRKKIWVIGAVCLVAIAGGWYYWQGRTAEPKYVTQTVHRGNLTSSVQATGTLNALTTVPVGSYVSGTVQYIFADFNTRVHAGQILAQLDPAIYEAQVTQARGNLENAQANLVTRPPTSKSTRRTW
jgi:HlyD family secretion protein